MFLRCRIAFLSGCALLVADPVLAATPAEAGPPVLEEVVVSAQKRDENLQDAPLSVSVLSADQLARNGIVDIRSLGNGLPNVQINYTATNTMVTIRGIGINASPVLTDQAVSVNVDGVYMARSNALNGAFFDMDRVEVLRGPQGTLYGRNSTAGAINIYTAKPRFEYAGSAEVEYGRFDRLRFSGMLNAPLGEKIAARAAFQTDRRDGYMSNGSGRPESTAARLHLLAQPTDNLRILLSGDYLDLGGDVGAWQPTSAPKFTSPYDQTGAYRDGKASGVQAEINWDVGDVTLTYLGARRTYDMDHVLKAAITLSELSSDEVWTHELRLGSSSESARLQWLLGLYALDMQGAYNAVVQSGANTALIPNPRRVERAHAAFGQATLSLTDSVRVTAGARYSEDKKHQHAFDAFGSPVENKDSWDSTNWRVALEVDATDDSLLYASVSTGFKAGGFFAGAPPNSFDPEDLTAYALGSKNTFANGSLRLNAEAFYYDYEGLQISYLDYINPFPAFGSRISNVGRAEVYGLELDGNWAFTSDDRIDFSASYLHAQYKDFVVPGSLFPPPNGRPPADHSGQTMTSSPEWSGRIAYSHIWRLANGNMLTGSVSSVGAAGQWLNFVHIPEAYQPSYVKFDASLAFDFVDRDVTIMAYGRNLTNQAVAVLYTNSNGTQVQYDLPRTYGVTIAARF